MNKEKLPVRLFLALSFFLSAGLAGCKGQPEAPLPAGTAVLIQSKAQIKNEDESHTVNIEIALVPQKAARLEISATLGVAVASVLLTPDRITYALHSSKQFVTGPFHAKTLYPVFKKEIDPRLLWKVIHDQSPAGKDLQCRLNSLQKPVECVAADGSKVNWTYEEPPRRRIDIKSNRFEMGWIFKDQKPLTGDQNETFVLKKPEDYREIIIK